jgi:hypothetical protein
LPLKTALYAKGVVVQESEKYVDKIKSSAANLYVVAAFYLGFAFFDTSLIPYIIALVVLGFPILKWKSRIASIITAIFGGVTLYIFLNKTSVDSFVLLGAAVVIWSGLHAAYYSFKFHKLAIE